MSNLSLQDHITAAYIDDLINIDNKLENCVESTNASVYLLDSLGFIVHPLISVLIPTQIIEYLGFIIDSRQMKIYLTDKKKQSFIDVFKEMQHEKDFVSIRRVVRLLGKISSSFPGVKYGRLHYRKIERDKSEALKIAKGNFEKKMSLSCQALDEIKWWLENIDHSYNDIHIGNPDITMNTDACKTG